MALEFSLGMKKFRTLTVSEGLIFATLLFFSGEMVPSLSLNIYKELRNEEERKFIQNIFVHLFSIGGDRSIET